MNETFGKRIARLRKEKSYTQEDIAFKVNISPQAVSKWENDISFPDITVLPILADIFEVSVDELLGRKNNQQVVLVEEAKKEDINKMALKIKVIDGKDKININIPIALVKVCIETGMGMPQINGNKNLSSIDFKQIYDLIEQGVVGELLTVESEDGTFVKIVVE